MSYSFEINSVVAGLVERCAEDLFKVLYLGDVQLVNRPQLLEQLKIELYEWMQKMVYDHYYVDEARWEYKTAQEIDQEYTTLRGSERLVTLLMGMDPNMSRKSADYAVDREEEWPTRRKRKLWQREPIDHMAEEVSRGIRRRLRFLFDELVASDQWVPKGSSENE